MSQTDFEARRRERRRRERRRKKRIRAALLLIALIALIAIICTAVSTSRRRNGTDAENTAAQATAVPEATPTATPTPASLLNIPEPSEENDLLQIIADSGQTKRCYLTFDDGPTENITPQILDVLRRYNVKATFFEVGSLIDANPDMAARVYEEGHLIANHSYSHNYEKLYASTDAFITEIQRCEDSISGVMKEDKVMSLIRFPGGSYNSGDHAEIKQECKELLKQNGFYYIDWNSLNGDAEGKTKNAQELLDYAKQTMEGYNNLVILMHDASSKQATVDALGSIIEYIMSQGYTFHRLDDIDYQGQAQSDVSVTDTASDTDGGGDSAADNSDSGSADSGSTGSDSSDSNNSGSSNSGDGNDNSDGYDGNDEDSGAPAPTPRTNNIAATAAPVQQNGAIIIQ